MTSVKPLDETQLAHAAAVMRALGHPVRLQILEALAGGECTVSELEAYTGQAQPIVSQQLAVLKRERVVAGERDGNFVRYHITEPRVVGILACIRKKSSRTVPQ